MDDLEYHGYYRRGGRLGDLGGLGNQVGPQQLNDDLDMLGASYVVSLLGFGSITLKELGPADKTGAVLLGINGDTTGVKVPPTVQLVISDPNTVEITTETGLQSFPLLNQASSSGPVLQTAVDLVAGAPGFQAVWSSNPMQLLSTIGLPDSCTDNLEYGVDGYPSGSDQFAAWAQSISFSPTSLECELCQALVVGAVSVAAAAVAAACLATGEGAIAAAVEAVSQLDVIAKIGELVGVPIPDLAQLAVQAYWDDAAHFVTVLCQAVCKAAGACGGGK